MSKKKALVVVDMQNDFVTGALGTKEAVEIVPRVVEKVRAAIAAGELVVFTQDTHGEDYAETQEGRNLPVPHCVKGSWGWEIIPELREFAEGRHCLEKGAFGSMQLGWILEVDGCAEVELIGLCTDICVISNAMVLKAQQPEWPISVDSSCCAGVTPQSHINALEAMKMCQIEVK